MRTTFYIDLSLNTPRGPELYARFFIGDNRDIAYELFDQLTGTTDVSDKNILYVDLIEISDGLPVNLKMITCTLEQVAMNCKTITKKAFQLANLK